MKTLLWIGLAAAAVAIIGGFSGQRWLLVAGATVLLLVIVSLPFRTDEQRE